MFFLKKPLASEMAWCEGTLKKRESPEDERHHPQRKGNEALMNYNFKWNESHQNANDENNEFI